MSGNKKVLEETVVMEKNFLASFDQSASLLAAASAAGVILANDDEEYPHCALHPNYFALALHQLERNRGASALSISSEFDNREILKVIRKQ